MRWDLFAIMMLLPWLATFGGSLMAARIRVNAQKGQGPLLGFAAGVMVAASVWSLIIRAFDEMGTDFRAAAVVSLGFALGCAGMLLLDKLVPHQHMDENSPEGRPSHMSRPMLLVLAVALHNIPEGLALGVVISAALQDTGMTWTAAIVFGIGLALQNFPEGIAVVLPLKQTGSTAKRCAWWGFWASLAEPAAAVVGIALTSLLTAAGGVVLPILLSVAAGAMVFITVEELIPESQAGGHGHGATYGFLLGFWLMALLGILGG